MNGELADRFPQDVALKDGGTVQIQLMEQGDRDALLEFAQGLHEQDLLFLRVGSTNAIRLSGTPNSTSKSVPQLTTPTCCPADTFSLTSTSTEATEQSSAAVSRV